MTAVVRLVFLTLLWPMVAAPAHALTCDRLTQSIYLECQGGLGSCKAVFQSLEVAQANCAAEVVIHPVPVDVAALAARLAEAQGPTLQPGLYSLNVKEPIRDGVMRPDLEDFARRLDAAMGLADEDGQGRRSLKLPATEIVAAMGAYGGKAWWYRVGEEASTSATAHYAQALREHAREMQIRIRIFTVVTWGAGVLGLLLLLHTAALFFQRLHEGATPWRTGLMLAVQGSVGALAAYLSESFLWPNASFLTLLACTLGAAEGWAWLRHLWRLRRRAGRVL